MTSKLVLFEKQDVLGFMTDFYRDDKGNLYMTREQIGLCLGYADPAKAIRQIHDRNHELLDSYAIQTKLRKMAQSEAIYGTVQKYSGTARGRGNVVLYQEKGIYLIAMKADTDKAIVFQKAVADILENLRKGYQVWLLERERGKAVRKTLTDAIRDDYPDSPHKKFMYKNFTDLTYRIVFGKTAKKLREELGLAKDANLRDKISPQQLKKLQSIESIVRGYVELGYSYETVKSMLTPLIE